ncbi:dephospho-CoA kinase [Salinimicrobium xinjiangense]|uniref:dephospho-CoA kinase n=1 Tax=Salinimicrobium xinjiangense TaxID=438596 RepID=UPI00041A8F17|nr:dephospho-CoA kinase [Salinimicrobium xinjiangense]
MKILGLTGGIGSGKTTVAGFFRELGIPVFIADVEAKKIMEEDERVKIQIKDLLGEEAYLDDFPNRKYIAAQVFNDKDQLEQLNAIIHPAVGRKFDSWKAEQEAPYVVYEAAILFEKGGYKKCDYNLLVTAPLPEKLKRLQKRDNSSSEEIKARMNHQWSDEKKAKLADFVIENFRLNETREAVRRLHKTLLESA